MQADEPSKPGPQSLIGSAIRSLVEFESDANRRIIDRELQVHALRKQVEQLSAQVSGKESVIDSCIKRIAVLEHVIHRSNEGKLPGQSVAKPAARAVATVDTGAVTIDTTAEGSHAHQQETSVDNRVSHSDRNVEYISALKAKMQELTGDLSALGISVDSQSVGAPLSKVSVSSEQDSKDTGLPSSNRSVGLSHAQVGTQRVHVGAVKALVRPPIVLSAGEDFTVRKTDLHSGSVETSYGGAEGGAMSIDCRCGFVVSASNSDSSGSLAVRRLDDFKSVTVFNRLSQEASGASESFAINHVLILGLTVESEKRFLALFAVIARGTSDSLAAIKVPLEELNDSETDSHGSVARSDFVLSPSWMTELGDGVRVASVCHTGAPNGEDSDAFSVAIGLSDGIVAVVSFANS